MGGGGNPKALDSSVNTFFTLRSPSISPSMIAFLFSKVIVSPLWKLLKAGGGAALLLGGGGGGGPPFEDFETWLGGGGGGGGTALGGGGGGGGITFEGGENWAGPFLEGKPVLIFCIGGGTGGEYPGLLATVLFGDSPAFGASLASKTTVKASSLVSSFCSSSSNNPIQGSW